MAEQELMVWTPNNKRQNKIYWYEQQITNLKTKNNDTKNK
jgi:hypothetical protein